MAHASNLSLDSISRVLSAYSGSEEKGSISEVLSILEPQNRTSLLLKVL